MSDEAPKGHIKVARRTFDSDTWWLEPRKLSKWEAWVDMIQLAQWAPRDVVTTKFGTIRLERGEFVASIRTLAKRWNWGVQSVRSFTQSAEFLTRVVAQRETQAGTVYLIVNYDRYQGSFDADSTASNTAANTPVTHLQHTSNTRTSSKAVKHKSTAAPSADELRVLEHYRTRHPRRRVADSDAGIVRKALGFGYSADELCEAIDGNADDAWHRDKRKHGLSYVLRNRELIDGFRMNAEPLQPIVDEFGVLTAYGQRLTDPSHA